VRLASLAFVRCATAPPLLLFRRFDTPGPTESPPLLARAAAGRAHVYNMLLAQHAIDDVRLERGRYSQKRFRLCRVSVTTCDRVNVPTCQHVEEATCKRMNAMCQHGQVSAGENGCKTESENRA
jgi:hypothetical protein